MCAILKYSDQRDWCDVFTESSLSFGHSWGYRDYLNIETECCWKVPALHIVRVKEGGQVKAWADKGKGKEKEVEGSRYRSEDGRGFGGWIGWPKKWSK